MKDLNSDIFAETISTGNVVIDFWAEWCGPCKMLTPIINELDNEIDNISFFAVDADANVKLAQELEISSIPTILFYSNGELVHRQVGALPKALMRKIIDDTFSQ
jgi:thioredoxin 1